MKTILTIIKEYFRIGLLSEMEYRVNFFLQVFESLIGLIAALGGLIIVFNHTETLGGWLPDQLVALVGIYLLIGGLINFVISPSMEQFMQEVRVGTLDFALTKPADAQLLVSIRRFEIWKFVDIVLGIIVLSVGLYRLRSTIVLQETAVFLIVLFCGITIIYCFWIILATFSFWFVRVQNILVIFQSMYLAARWPVSIYPSWLRFGLTFIVPVAFAVTIPVEGLIGKLSVETFWTAVTLTIAMLFIARWFWKYGLRFYSGASA